MKKLQGSEDHLRSCQVDHNPRNEAFWFRGHIDPDYKMIRKREGTMASDWNKRIKNPMTQEKVEAKFDRAIQFIGEGTHIQIRTRMGLPAYLDGQDDLVTSGTVPLKEEIPESYGWSYRMRHGTNLLASWTGSEYPFSHLALWTTPTSLTGRPRRPLGIRTRTRTIARTCCFPNASSTGSGSASARPAIKDSVPSMIHSSHFLLR